MPDKIHLLKKTEAVKRLTLAVRLTQGGKKASWAAANKPQWWLELHQVELENGERVTTGPFISNSKKSWKISEIRAALTLYHQWREQTTAKPENKEKAENKEKVEQTEIPGPVSSKSELALRKSNRRPVLRSLASSNSDNKENEAPLQPNLPKSSPKHDNKRPSDSAAPARRPGKKARFSPEIEVQSNDTVGAPEPNSSEGLDDQNNELERTEHQRRVQRIREAIFRIEEVQDQRLRKFTNEVDRLISRNKEETRLMTNKLKAAYKFKILNIPKRILQMPIAEYITEHRGNADTWMMKETERGVDQALREVLEEKEPSIKTRRHDTPPRSEAAMSRRDAITKTARKTGRRVRAQLPPVAPSTVRRSKRTAAKTATARNRVLIGKTPGRQIDPGEIAYSANQSPLEVQRRPDINASRAHRRRDPDISHVMASIRKQANPMRALEEWKKELAKMEQEIRGEL